DEKDEDPHDKNHDRLQQRSEPGDHAIHFGVINLSDPAQHFFDLTASLSDGNHVCRQSRKLPAAFQWIGDCFTFPNVPPGLLDSLFEYSVIHDSLRDV